MIDLVIMTDGRGIFLKPAIESLSNLIGPITNKVIHDDSADPRYAEWLNKTYGGDFTIWSTDRRSGFGGAIISAWSVLSQSDNPWVFHLEDDFVIKEQINLYNMITVMSANPHLVQMALLRQPWNEAEAAAGGIIQTDPGAYTEVVEGDNAWVEHRKFFTTNPSLYRKSLIQEHPWPTGNQSEGRYGISLFQDAKKRSAFWGGRHDEPKVFHIGEFRNGAGY